MALVMFRCFECEFVSSSMQEVKLHIQLEHEGGVKLSENTEDMNVVEISDRCQVQDAPCVVPQEALSGSMRWTRDMVLFLIECFKKHEDKFHKIGYTSKQVWYHISKDFSQKYFNISSECCNEKWRNLKRTYKNIKKNLERTGSSRIKFRYFEEMDDIYSKTPEIIHPITITASRSLSEDEPVIQKVIKKTSPSAIKEENSASCSSPLLKNRKRAVPHCCSHFLLEMKKMEDAREISKQKRHEEKMELLRELIDIKRQKLVMLQKLS